MGPSANQPALRLVGAQQPAPPATTAMARAMAAIERANRESAAIPHEDVRRIFALEVATTLQGGRAAVLTPEARRRLLTRADQLGLRPFDASLVIAVTQDNARRGAGADATRDDARLDLVHAPDSNRARTRALFAATLILAGGLLALLIAWVLG